MLAGLAAVTLVAVIAFQAGRSSPPPAGPPAAGAPAGGAGGGMPDLASMGPREQADRLFNRVMTAHEQGDQGSVDLFKPMALQAYGMLGTLDPDAHYHVGVMQVVTGEVDDARARADSIEAQVPELAGYADIDEIVILVTERCRVDTVRIIRRNLTDLAECIPTFGILDRLYKDKHGWQYCAGQSYPDEMRTVRKILKDMR